MSTPATGFHLERHAHEPLVGAHPALRYVELVGRVFLAAIFIVAAPGHFQAPTIAYAASHGVPLAGVLVPLSGLLALLGGIGVLLGLRARIAALLLVVFLVPVTLRMHDFWNVADPMMRQIQIAMFLKNVAMLGGALLVVYHGAGPISLDERRG